MGEVLDVAVDLRKGSPSYGQCVSQVLSADNMLQMLVPIGFGHAFLTLSDYAEVQYKCSDYYAPDSEGNILWNDPEISFDWPVNDPILSKRDAAAQTFREYDQHPAFRYP
jgi:dTDP-4-dehydrorhamnose 3,5-epimerase